MIRTIIVDDVINNCKLLVALLNKWGYESEYYTNPVEAYETINSIKSPTILILDWMMPELSGLDICSMVRESPPEYPIYIMILTAKASMEDLSSGLEAGADDFIGKPFNHEELRTRYNVGRRSVALMSELEQSKKENEAIIRSISSAIIGLNSSKKIKFWNYEAEKKFKITKEEAFGKEITDLPIEFKDNMLQEWINVCSISGSSISNNEIELTTPSKISFLVSVTPMGVSSKKEMLISLLDISHKKKVEASLSHNHKMQSIGQLAAGMAHEINTPIQFIGDNTKFLGNVFSSFQEYIKKTEKLYELEDKEEIISFLNLLKEDNSINNLKSLMDEVPFALEDNIEGVRRVSTIISAMKEFANPCSDLKSTMDLNKAIENTLIITRNEWEPVCSIEKDFYLDLPRIYCCPDEINLVLIALLFNAAQAIAEKIKRENLTDKGKIKITTLKSEYFAEISISDNGIGIPESIKHKIFDPFFTTREVGKGTGQGLSTAYTVIVEKHDGEINFTSEEGIGSVFTVKLPLNNEF